MRLFYMNESPTQWKNLKKNHVFTSVELIR